MEKKGAPAALPQLVSCPSANAGELAKAVVEALRGDDPEKLACAYAVLTDEVRRGGCLTPLDDTTKPKFAKLFAESKADCAKALPALDWSTAKVASISGGKLQREEDVCGRKVSWHEDIDVIVESSGGKHTIKIDDVFAIDGKLAVTADLLVCKATK